MTAMTTMSVATPSKMPKNEKPAMTEMKASLRRERRYLQASMRSKAENGPLTLAERSVAVSLIYYLLQTG
jgi:hypothetical protein